MEQAKANKHLLTSHSVDLIEKGKKLLESCVSYSKGTIQVTELQRKMTEFAQVIAYIEGK